MFKKHILYIFCISTSLATPPACFLSCINELAHYCPNGHSDLSCLCRLKDSLVGCLVDICPLGTLDSARDHFVGTCLEHRRPHDPPQYVIPIEAGDYSDEPEVPLQRDATSPSRARPKTDVLPSTKNRLNGLMRQGVPSNKRTDGSVVH